MKSLLLIALIFGTATLVAQPEKNIIVKDDAKVGFISTGTGASINVTQIFGKSPEYAELKSRLAALDNKIKAKADKCGKYTDPVAKDDCRAELIALNAERDSVQKIETRFRDDVIRLAETFANIPLNSERLRLAKQFFDEGKIREADNVLNAKEMQQEGDALLAKKAGEQQALHTTDSLLLVKADEFALKARLKVTDYSDSLRYDSAIIYFEQSRRYAETVDRLWAFAHLLGQENQTPRAIGYYEAALKLARSESEEAALAVNLGNFYSDVQKMGEAEKMYLRSLDIYERLAKSNPAQFEPDLARICMGLGVFYSDNDRQKEAISILRKGLAIQENLAEKIPVMHTKSLAYMLNNLGFAYLKDNDFSNARHYLTKSQSLALDNSWVFRNWACLFALQNDVDKSIEHLKKAAELGYDDPDWIIREKSLETIHGDSAFPAILKTIGENKRKKKDY
ncbi:MAG: tetratricopeptide repeat protein [Saprospiraceae bacterium]|nr:tetratricopeptide repeat protein [Saprospiraceae bacterium]